MEGVSVATSIFDLFKIIGPIATVLILCVIAYFIIREIKKENERTRNSVSSVKKEMSEMKEEFTAAQRKFEENMEEKAKCQDENIKEIQNDIRYIQREYITKEDHYRDTEGWKAEMLGVKKDLAELPLKVIGALEKRK